MPREFLRLTRESTFNTYNTSPGPTDVCLISIPQSNAFTMRSKPNQGSLRSRSFNNRATLQYSFTADLAGKLMTYVRPSQAAFLLGMAANLTTSNCPELGSFTADHGIMLEDSGCSAVYRRYTGCKMDASFSVNNTIDGCLMMLSCDLMACGYATITSTDFPVPAASAYPDFERPYAFYDSVGTLTVGGARTKYSQFNFSFGNILRPIRNELKYPSYITYRGRDPKFGLKNLYTSFADRAAYEAITPQPISFTFSENGGSVALNLNTHNYYADVDDDLPLDTEFQQSISFNNLIDPTAGADFTLTVTAPTTPSPTPTPSPSPTPTPTGS